MQKFWYYIDYGSGFVEVNPVDVNVSLKLKRGVLNDFIVRKELDGNFKLNDTEFTDAETYFITNGNEEAPIRLYENGDSGSGVLQYEGWTRVKGDWDFREKLVTFDTFRTDDEYTTLLEKYNNTFEGESLVGFASFSSFASQGQHANANKLFNFTFDGTNFSTTGTPLAVANLGRCSIDEESGELVMFDNVNDVLTSYTISAGQWSQVRTRSLLRRYYNGTVVGLTGTQVAVIYDDVNLIEVFTFSGGSSFSLTSQFNTSDLKFPDVCWTGNAVTGRIALVDENQKTLRVINTSGQESDPLSLGDIKRPKLCVVDPSIERIAFIDANQKKLVAYSYSGGAFSQVGNSYEISGLLAPDIAQHSANRIVLTDTILGIIEMYDFDGTNWSQVGNTYSISGGYMSAISSDGSNILLAISDTHVFNGSVMTNYYGAINSLLLLDSIQGTGAGQYELQSSGTGATKDPNEIVLGDMSDISDNGKDAGNYNKYRYKLKDTLDWYKMFENYWYVEDVAGAYKIKFIQPDSFSTVGTDIDVSALDAATELNQRVYKDEFNIDKEELILNNINSADFQDNIIDYLRNTSVIKSDVAHFTTDLEYLIKIYTGQLIQQINSAGLMMYYKDDSTGARLAVSGTGIISGTDTKNYLLSQSQIYNDHWDTYRYKDKGNITINGVSVPVGDSCKNIIDYSDIKFSESDVGLTQFPSSIGSVIWGGGVSKSLIMELSLNLSTREYTASSRLHDI